MDTMSDIGFTIFHAFAHDGGYLVYVVAALGISVGCIGDWIRANG
jgi:hypothetical protein